LPSTAETADDSYSRVAIVCGSIAGLLLLAVLIVVVVYRKWRGKEFCLRPGRANAEWIPLSDEWLEEEEEDQEEDQEEEEEKKEEEQQQKQSEDQGEIKELRKGRNLEFIGRRRKEESHVLSRLGTL